MKVDGLKWVMELMDRTSGPARRVVASLNAVRAAQDSVRSSAARAARTPDPLATLERATGQRRAQRQRQIGRELEQFARSQNQASSSSGLFSSILGGVGSVLMVVGAAAIAAAGAIASVGASAARSVVELGGFQESTMVAMQTMLGSRGAADQEFGSALRIARLTPFDTRNVVSLRRQLLGAGFRDTRERDVMTAVISDISAMNPEDSTIMQRLGLAIGQIRGAGRLRGQELNQLNQAGLGREYLFAALGEQLNLRGTAPAVNEQINRLMAAGRITDRVAFAAMARAITRMTGTERAGQYSANQGATVLGLLSTLGSSIPELLLGRGPDGTTLFEGAGFSALKSFLKQVVDLLSSTSATGQRLQKIMRGVIDEVFGVLNISDKNTKGGLTAIFERALDAIESVIGGVRTLLKWGQAFYGSAFETFGETFEVWRIAMGSIFDDVDGEGPNAIEILKTIGKLGGWIASAYLMAYTGIGGAIYLLFYPFIQMYEAIKDTLKLIEDGWNAFPEPLRAAFSGAAALLFGSGEVDQSLFTDATNVVNQGRDPSVGRPVVSQPSVTVNVNAMAAGGSTPEEIASAAAAGVPPAVQGAADRASRRAGA